MIDIDPETHAAINAHIKRLEHLALTERKTTERGKEAVRSLAIMALLSGLFDDPPSGDEMFDAEVIDLDVFRNAA